MLRAKKSFCLLYCLWCRFAVKFFGDVCGTSWEFKIFMMQIWMLKNIFFKSEIERVLQENIKQKLLQSEQFDRFDRSWTEPFRMAFKWKGSVGKSATNEIRSSIALWNRQRRENSFKWLQNRSPDIFNQQLIQTLSEQKTFTKERQENITWLKSHQFIVALGESPLCKRP